jgi:hypothetical protein
MEKLFRLSPCNHWSRLGSRLIPGYRFSLIQTGLWIRRPRIDDTGSFVLLVTKLPSLGNEKFQPNDDLLSQQSRPD